MLSYSDLFKEIKTSLLESKPEATSEITQAVNNFFIKRFSSSYKVFCSSEGNREFLTDIFVSNFDPLDIVQQKSFGLSHERLEIYIAVESEIGGTGASSAYGVMKNVVEDFMKLASINASYKVMVFTSLPYANEKDHISARVNTLRDVYSRSPCNDAEVLLIHLLGSQPNSNQVKATISDDSIAGFCISKNGRQCMEI